MNNASESVIDVLVEMTAASGKQVLAAVQIMGNGRINGTRIDTNKVATVHGNTDSIARLIDAINENQKGNVAVFYINKDKTTKALQRTGNPIPSGLSNLDGFIKSISDSGSPVKRRISSVAESQQFKRWFGDWEMHPQNASKVVNADGTPKIVYHGTNAEFDVFQSEDGNYWFSESDDYAEAMMIERNGSRIIPAYLNMRNPYIASLPADQFTNPAYENPIIQKAKSGGYDGVIIENETDNDLAYDKFYVVFSPAQIKSASDNIGTFDGDNPSIRYSFSDTQVADQGHRPANGWYDTDEVEMQARKKGYPVLHGEQVVPFNTWVKTRDRGNYGLVTGIAPGNKLLVSFHNKHDGGTADNVAIAYDNLIPVPGEHQMTKEEFASLMESEPLDPNDQELSEEDMRAMEELYRRSGGEDAEGGKKVEPIDMESLPRRAQQYLKRTQSTLLRDLAKRLGVSKFVDRSFLQETVNEICMEYLNTGTVSDEKLGELFDKTYKQGKLWDENPNLDQAKIRGAVQQFRQIYDDLFSLMNRVRVENGYEPINYRSGYFPHFQPGASDGILAQFGRALGIDTQVVALPTTINGLTHTFKPGIQWFGNAQERLGFNTAYDAVEGFDKYIEGAASVIFQTGNVQRLRAFATQVRYRTSEKGIQEQVDAVYEDNRLTDEEKQIKIANIYEHGKYELGNFVAELDEYTNLLANKKSKYDRTVEALMGRKSYVFLKWLESRVGANMIAGNISSALTNFIPLTQAGAQIDKSALMKGMLQTLVSLKNDDGLLGASTFLTNRRGSDPLVRTWVEKASVTAGFLMDAVDQFVSGSVVRGAYYHNLKRGLSEAEAMHQADIFAAGVMADRSKGSMPTLMQASNPVFKLFTQFQLEVNNQFSEVFKDLPRNHREKGVGALALVFLQYFLGAWLFNNLFEELFGRRPALDPIGIVLDAGKDFSDPDVGFGEGIKNLGSDVLEELPFSSGLNLLGFELDGGRFPVESAIPDLTAIGEAITAKPYDPETKTGWSGKKRWKEISDELSKPLAYIIPPFGGNQVSKTVKGIGAFIQGGSYSVDAAGEDILQYPVYKDDPWAALGSLFRASILGKSSLPEAQEWVEGGFDSLNAKETAVYKEMLEVGVTDRDAYALLQELGAAKKTEDLSKKAVQRQILMDSGTSDEGKTIAYYGLLATRPDDDSDTMSEQEIMDALTDLGANPWEAAKTLIKIADANALESEAERTAKCDAIIEAALTDDEKSVIVGRYILDSDEMLTEKGDLTEWAKYMAAVEGGLGVNEYLKFRKTGGDIDDYLGFSYAGLKPDDAIDAAQAMDDLVPLNGKKQVSDIQRWRACVDTFTNEATQMAALAAKMDDTQYAKLDLAYGYGISPDTYVTLREDLPKYDADGSGSITKKEVQKAVSAVRGLSSTQRAVLWQIVTGSKSAKGNPFNINAGQGVLDALEKLKENSDVGLTFQEEIIRQWNLKG